MTDTQTACLNCGVALHPEAKFCSQCGQEKLGRQDRHLSALLRSSFEEATSLNGKVLPSFARLLFKPGTLTRAYLEGKRHRHLKPISVFLMATLVFFLAPPLSDFNIVLLDQYTLQPYSSIIRPVIDNAIAAAGSSFEALAVDYNERVVDVAKLMVIFHVPFIALFTFLVGFDRRYLYADHVVAAMHYFSFLMIFQAFYPLLASSLIALLPEMNSNWIWTVAGLPRVVYIPIMIHFAFRLPWYRTLIITAAYMPVFLGVHFIYRFVQFWIIFGMVSP